MPGPRSQSPAIPAELADYLDELVRRLREDLGDQLVGIYLHGSASMGAFVPSRSDVDVLVVTDGPISGEIKPRLADDLSSRALPCPGVGLELSIVASGSLRHLTNAPSFELHLDMQEDHPDRVVDGSESNGDPDLLAHYAMAKEHAIALMGPPATTMFPGVERGRLIRTLVDDLGWGLAHGHLRSAVLNACRALRFAREGVLSSKPEGGAWALDNGVGDRATIEAALRRQAGSDEEVDAFAAAAFVEGIRRELEA